MISSRTIKGALFASAAAVAVILPTGSANATNGYFTHGFGTASKGMAGAGQTAMGFDSQAGATNPAAMRDVGNRMDVSVSVFSPVREYTEVTNSGGTAVGTGTYQSGAEAFVIPGFSYNRNLDSQSSLGLGLYANGGMNTSYKTSIFGGTNSGVDLAQMFMGLSYSKDINSKLSVGIMPKLALQRFSATGLSNFNVSGQTSSVGNVTDKGIDWSYGYGVSFGATYDVSDQVSVGAAYHSRTFMTEFDDYAGLFAEQGDFDVPSSVNLGITYKASNKLTLSADLQHIRYGEVAAIANKNPQGGKLGLDNGAGFGWENLNTLKLGASYAYDDKTTLRAGISHNDQNPYGSTEYLFNILAPAVIRTHVSVGASYKNTENSDLSFALTHGLSENPSGSAPAGVGGGTFKHKMHQWDLEVAYTHHF